MGRINVTYSIFEGPSGPNDIRYSRIHVHAARIHRGSGDNRIKHDLMMGTWSKNNVTFNIIVVILICTEA